MKSDSEKIFLGDIAEIRLQPCRIIEPGSLIRIDINEETNDEANDEANDIARQTMKNPSFFLCGFPSKSISEIGVMKRFSALFLGVSFTAWGVRP